MLRKLVALVAIAATLSACVSTRFYDPAATELAGAPGSIIRQERLPDGPGGSTAWRVLYRSVGLHGEPIAVSAVILIPPGPAPADGRRIVAWAHPTTGVATECAPSLSPLQYLVLAGVDELIADGYVIAATDYPGLGTPGTHPYLVGESEARAVLDSVRATRAIVPDAGTRIALWGHSQGGHAAIWTSLLAEDYAPEFTIVGIALAAPATELSTLIRADADTDEGKNLTAMAVWAWSRVFDTPLQPIVDPDQLATVNRVASYCIDTISGLIERRAPAATLDEGFLTVADITTVEPWERFIRENTPGVTPAGLPVFIGQGEADTLVHPNITQNYFARLCAAGRPATLLMMPGIDHGAAGRAAAPTAIQWIGDRFDGAGGANACPR